MPLVCLEGVHDLVHQLSDGLGRFVKLGQVCGHQAVGVFEHVLRVVENHLRHARYDVLRPFPDLSHHGGCLHGHGMRPARLHEPLHGQRCQLVNVMPYVHQGRNVDGLLLGIHVPDSGVQPAQACVGNIRRFEVADDVGRDDVLGIYQQAAYH